MINSSIENIGSTWVTEDDFLGSVAPSRAFLPKSLVAHRVMLSLDELVNLCSDLHDDVQINSITALVEIASTNLDVLAELLAKIKSEILPTKVMLKVLSLPVESLRPVKSELINLYNSLSAKVREELVRALASADWLDREEAIILARQALQDNNLRVRDQAVETLRIIESQ